MTSAADLKERGIIMTASSVQSILAGRKTQTRRVANPQPHAGVRENPFGPGLEDGHGRPIRMPWKVDRLWVREAFTLGMIPPELEGAPQLRRGPVIEERPGDTPGAFPDWRWAALYDGDEDPGGWFTKYARRSPLFMPRWASRMTLEVTALNLQRLDIITEADAWAEGVQPRSGSVTRHEHEGRDLYRALWESIHGPESWNPDLWVWRIEFKAITPTAA